MSIFEVLFVILDIILSAFSVYLISKRQIDCKDVGKFPTKRRLTYLGGEFDEISAEMGRKNTAPAIISSTSVAGCDPHTGEASRRMHKNLLKVQNSRFYLCILS